MALAVSTAVQVNCDQLGQEATQEPTSAAQTRSALAQRDASFDTGLDSQRIMGQTEAESEVP